MKETESEIYRVSRCNFGTLTFWTQWCHFPSNSFTEPRPILTSNISKTRHFYIVLFGSLLAFWTHFTILDHYICSDSYSTSSTVTVVASFLTFFVFYSYPLIFSLAWKISFFCVYFTVNCFHFFKRGKMATSRQCVSIFSENGK